MIEKVPNPHLSPRHQTPQVASLPDVPSGSRAEPPHANRPDSAHPPPPPPHFQQFPPHTTASTTSTSELRQALAQPPMLHPPPAHTRPHSPLIPERPHISALQSYTADLLYGQAIYPGSVRPQVLFTPEYLAAAAHRPLLTAQSSPHRAQTPGSAAQSPRSQTHRDTIVWQGEVELKSERSLVSMLLVGGSKRLAELALPPAVPEGCCPILKVVQRMRLAKEQLDGVTRRMSDHNSYALLIATAQGISVPEKSKNERVLSASFIQYLSQKGAAGIVNVPGPDPLSPHAAYVVHIFPPCEFAKLILLRLAPNFAPSITDTPHLLVIITTT